MGSFIIQKTHCVSSLYLFPFPLESMDVEMKTANYILSNYGDKENKTRHMR